MEHFQFHNAQSNAHCTVHLPAPRGVEERNSRGALINQDRLLAFAAPLSTYPPSCQCRNGMYLVYTRAVGMRYIP